tara:strand:+ start:985 stop:1095 length:111 start_codon:yes stop_codon:yes gene_type:complete
MILPHDANKGKVPKDAKLFGLFVFLAVTGIILFLTL